MGILVQIFIINLVGLAAGTDRLPPLCRARSRHRSENSSSNSNRASTTASTDSRSGPCRDAQGCLLATPPLHAGCVDGDDACRGECDRCRHYANDRFDDQQQKCAAQSEAASAQAKGAKKPLSIQLPPHDAAPPPLPGSLISAAASTSSATSAVGPRAESTAHSSRVRPTLSSSTSPLLLPPPQLPPSQPQPQSQPPLGLPTSVPSALLTSPNLVESRVPDQVATSTFASLVPALTAAIESPEPPATEMAGVPDWPQGTTSNRSSAESLRGPGPGPTHLPAAFARVSWSGTPGKFAAAHMSTNVGTTQGGSSAYVVPTATARLASPAGSSCGYASNDGLMAVPPFNGSTPGSPALSASSSYTSIGTDDELFPRPYRTFCNMEPESPPSSLSGLESQASTSPPGRFSWRRRPKKLSPVCPAMPAASPELIPSARILPPTDLVEYVALDWKLPLTAPLRTARASDLCASKSHLPGYSTSDSVGTYEALQAALRDLVAQSYAVAQAAQALPTSSVAHAVYHSATHGAPLPPGTSTSAANQAALVARLLRTLYSDLFVALTSPLRVTELRRFIKTLLPEVKKDLKLPKPPRHHGTGNLGAPPTPPERSNHQGMSAHFLFVLLDHLLSAPSLASALLAHLRPLLAHVVGTLSSQFQVHGLPAPMPGVLEELVTSWLDWLVRMKREFPAVGIFLAVKDMAVDARFVRADGGYAAPAPVVAFTTAMGIWDASVGAVGYPAKVWVKSAFSALVLEE